MASRGYLTLAARDPRYLEMAVDMALSLREHSDLPVALAADETLADIATQAAGTVARMGFTPRVALLSFGTFGNPPVSKAARIRDVVIELDRRQVSFEYDGEMGADVALDLELMARYPFCRLKGPANVLIMPALHSANISSKLLQQLGGGMVIGPLLVGLSRPVQIVPMNATVSDMLNIAAIAAHDAIVDEPSELAARVAAE